MDYLRFESALANDRGFRQEALPAGDLLVHQLRPAPAGRVPGYLAPLDRDGVGWTELRSADPGQIHYRDDDQMVVTPYPDPA